MSELSVCELGISSERVRTGNGRWSRPMRYRHPSAVVTLYASGMSSELICSHDLKVSFDVKIRTLDSTLSEISQLDGFLHWICLNSTSCGRMQRWRAGKITLLSFSASAASILMMFLMYAISFEIFLSCSDLFVVVWIFRFCSELFAATENFMLTFTKSCCRI